MPLAALEAARGGRKGAGRAAGAGGTLVYQSLTSRWSVRGKARGAEANRARELRVRRARRHSRPVQESRIRGTVARAGRVGQRMTMMAATSDERSVMEPGKTNSGQSQPVDRLKLLYPMVDEEKTPLPRSWSTKDKYSYIGLSQNNLRVHYKGTWVARQRATSARARRCASLVAARVRVSARASAPRRDLPDAVPCLVPVARGRAAPGAGTVDRLKMAGRYFSVCQRPKQRNQLISQPVPPRSGPYASLPSSSPPTSSSARRGRTASRAILATPPRGEGGGDARRFRSLDAPARQTK